MICARQTKPFLRSTLCNEGIQGAERSRPLIPTILITRVTRIRRLRDLVEAEAQPPGRLRRALKERATRREAERLVLRVVREEKTLSKARNSSRDSSQFSNPDSTSSASDSQRTGIGLADSADPSRLRLPSLSQYPSTSHSTQQQQQHQQNIAQSLLTSGSLPPPPGFSTASFAEFLGSADLPHLTPPNYLQSQPFQQQPAFGTNYYPTHQLASNPQGGGYPATFQALERGGAGAASGGGGSVPPWIPPINYETLTPQQQEILAQAHQQVLLLGAQQQPQSQYTQHAPPPPSNFRAPMYNPNTETSLHWNDRQVQEFLESTRLSAGPSSSSYGGLRGVGEVPLWPSGKRKA